MILPLCKIFFFISKSFSPPAFLRNLLNHDFFFLLLPRHPHRSSIILTIDPAHRTLFPFFFFSFFWKSGAHGFWSPADELRTLALHIPPKMF